MRRTRTTGRPNPAVIEKFAGHIAQGLIDYQEGRLPSLAFIAGVGAIVNSTPGGWNAIKAGLTERNANLVKIDPKVATALVGIAICAHCCADIYTSKGTYVYADSDETQHELNPIILAQLVELRAPIYDPDGGAVFPQAITQVGGTVLCGAHAARLLRGPGGRPHSPFRTEPIPAGEFTLATPPPATAPARTSF